MELNLKNKILRDYFFETITDVTNKGGDYIMNPEVKLCKNNYPIIVLNVKLDNIIQKGYTFGNKYFGIYGTQLNIVQFLIFINEYQDILLNFFKDNKVPNYEDFHFLIKKILTRITYSQSIEMYINNSLERWRSILLFETITLRDYLDDNIINLYDYIIDNKLTPKKYTRIITRSIAEPSLSDGIPDKKRKINYFTQECIKDGYRIKLGDNIEYSYEEIKSMWRWNSVMTPLKYYYTEKDKEDIIKFISVIDYIL